MSKAIVVETATCTKYQTTLGCTSIKEMWIKS